MSTTNLELLWLSQKQFALPRYCLLEGFAESSIAASGVCLQNLNANDLVVFSTLNSEYRLLVLDPPNRRVRVQGGGLFTEPTEAVLTGASYGGSMIRLGWICRGMQIELIRQTADKKVMNFLTSPVEDIRLESST